MASIAVGFSAVRRSSDVAQLVTSNVEVSNSDGAARIRVANQENDQLGVGQPAYLASLRTWGVRVP